MAFSQIGGYGIFKFTNLPPSSRISALGGNLNCVVDNDNTLAINNPALLNRKMDKQFSLSFLDYFAGSYFGSAAYAYTRRDSNMTFNSGIQFIQYGEFQRSDEQGNRLGTFNAAEYNIFTGCAKSFRNYTVGAQAKFLYSSFDAWSALGLAIDLGGVYNKPDKGVTAALVFKNIGYELKSYNELHEKMPFEIQAGTSIKPQHLPLRISIVAHDLQRFHMTYINPEDSFQLDLSTGRYKTVEKPKVSEDIFRHFIFGGELMLSQNFMIRFGYNHQRRKEMVIRDGIGKGTAGYSFGVGIRVNKFHISYGRAIYSVAGASNTFTVTMNMGEVIKKKNVSQ